MRSWLDPRTKNVELKTPHILILGGGFGGLSAANKIRSHLLPSQAKITILDKKDWFMVGFAKLWIIEGKRTFEDSANSLKTLPEKEINFIKEEITGIDMENKQVRTSTQTLQYDFLIISMGASLAPERIPGLEEFGMNLYDHNHLNQIHRKLKELKAGKLAVSIMGVPYKCPPAPFEACLLISSLLKRLETRDSIQIDFYSPAPITLPVAGPDVSEHVLQMLDAENITFHKSRKIKSVEKNKLVFEDGSADFDLLLAVPPHEAPPVIIESGLAKKGGFITISRDCKTNFEDVYAVGDVTTLLVSENVAVPKAGVFAEGEAVVAARSIISKITSSDDYPQFDGKGACFLESGKGTAALVKVDMFSKDKHSTKLTDSTVQHLYEKLEFEKERIAKWL